MGGSTDQTGQIGKDQDDRRGEENYAGLAVFRLFEHGRMPFVVIGVASDARLTAWRVAASRLGVV